MTDDLLLLLLSFELNDYKRAFHEEICKIVREKQQEVRVPENLRNLYERTKNINVFNPEAAVILECIRDVIKVDAEINEILESFLHLDVCSPMCKFELKEKMEQTKRLEQRSNETKLILEGILTEKNVLILFRELALQGVRLDY